MHANFQATKPSGVKDGSVEFFEGRWRLPRYALLAVDYSVLSGSVYSWKIRRIKLLSGNRSGLDN